VLVRQPWCFGSFLAGHPCHVPVDFQTNLGTPIMKFASFALLAAAVLSTGCASILNEQQQAVNVSASNAKPIAGNIDGAPFTGPGVVKVTRAKAGKVMTVDTAGCTKTTNLATEVDSKFFINILLGGAFGSTTDYSTERMWKYADNVVVNCTQ
jgi:hypothetical protein